MSPEVLATAVGSGVFATVATFVKVHWDAVKDHRAFKDAKEREKSSASEHEYVDDD